MPGPDESNYLEPYRSAAKRHGGGFGALLWASSTTQYARFDAMARLWSPRGKSILDVGCGRADFLRFCHERNLSPADYIGIEAVPPLADVAERDQPMPVKIVRADFVASPLSMFVAADVIYFSGSLNTVNDRGFYETIRRAFDATAETVVFNFLSSPLLAGATYLHWRSVGDVTAFARTLTKDVVMLSDYLDGDTTVCITKTRN
jgi:SAM-dependent methyltransferase